MELEGARLDSLSLVFSRDFSLPMVEIWYRSEAMVPKPWNQKAVPIQPFLVLERSNGTVSSYYHSNGLKWVNDSLIAAVQKDPNFLHRFLNSVIFRIEKIRPVYESNRVLSLEELKRFLTDFENGYPWIEGFWRLNQLADEGKINGDLKKLRELRQKTDKLSYFVDAVIRRSVKTLFPNAGEYSHVLSIEEIKQKVVPAPEILKARDSHFFFFDDQVWIGVPRELVEKVVGCSIATPKSSDATELKGQTVFSGNARGKVRILRGYADAGSLQDGEVLVSTMTLPVFGPDIAKAAAVVTDEGGLTCHAAIICRELKKPCVVGTLLATRSLQNGDLIEIDAEKGIIRKLK